MLSSELAHCIHNTTSIPQTQPKSQAISPSNQPISQINSPYSLSSLYRPLYDPSIIPLIGLKPNLVAYSPIGVSYPLF